MGIGGRAVEVKRMPVGIGVHSLLIGFQPCRANGWPFRRASHLSLIELSSPCPCLPLDAMLSMVTATGS